jgi:hypothetical protein
MYRGRRDRRKAITAREKVLKTKCNLSGSGTDFLSNPVTLSDPGTIGNVLVIDPASLSDAAEECLVFCGELPWRAAKEEYVSLFQGAVQLQSGANLLDRNQSHQATSVVPGGLNLGEKASALSPRLRSGWRQGKLDNLFALAVPPDGPAQAIRGDRHTAGDGRAKPEFEGTVRLLAAPHAVEKVAHVQGSELLVSNACAATLGDAAAYSLTKMADSEAYV